MLMAILLVGAVALGWLLAHGRLALRSAGRSHSLDRRLRWVGRHPAEVNTGDIERVLLRHDLSPADVRLVTLEGPPGVRPEVERADSSPIQTRRLPPGWDSFFDDQTA